MYRIKDPRTLQRVLCSELKAQAGQLHKMQCMLLGMFIGDRLEMPSALVPDGLSSESTIQTQWRLLQNNNAREFLDDVNELVAHDMTESMRIAQVFWTMRYLAAAPKLTMSMVGVASFAERYLSMNKYFTQAEIAFLDDNRDTMTAAYNMLADCIVQEV